MSELQPPAIELENPGEEMSESLHSRRYPMREHRSPRRFSDCVDWGKGCSVLSKDNGIVSSL